MANTISIPNLAGEIYAAMDTVAREQTGAINSVSINRGSEVASYGSTVRSHVTSPASVLTTYTPAMTPPDGQDVTVGNETFVLDKIARYPIAINGETWAAMNQGIGAEVIRKDIFTQGIRAIVNKIETDVVTAIKNGASRAVGTAGTAPFGSNTDLIIDAQTILIDNGCPMGDGQLSLVINSAAAANLKKLTNLQKVNESGSSDLLRRGELLDLYGFSIKQSAGIGLHTKGTVANATLNATAGAIGDTTVTLSAAGTGTIVAGDVLTFASDTNRYVVRTGDADVSDGGTLVLNGPGLMQAKSAATKAITITDSYRPSLAFHRSAVELAIRAPYQLPGGDLAVDRMVFSDPVSGLTFQMAQYQGYGQALFEITCFYGIKVWKSSNVALIVG